MKRLGNWRSIALIVVLVCLIFGGWYFSAQAIRSTYPQAWSDWKDKIQDAVTEYRDANNGSLPIVSSGAVIIDGAQHSVIDVCALIESKFIPSVTASCVSLPGIDNDNCDGGGCDICKDSHHYIWTVDQDGTVRSVCVGEGCGEGGSDGYQGVWP